MKKSLFYNISFFVAIIIGVIVYNVANLCGLDRISLFIGIAVFAYSFYIICFAFDNGIKKAFSKFCEQMIIFVSSVLIILLPWFVIRVIDLKGIAAVFAWFGIFAAICFLLFKITLYSVGKKNNKKS